MLQIKSGQYQSLPGQYSKELKGLVAAMLQTSAVKRPSANVILQTPYIRSRIDKFLTETLRYDGSFCEQSLPLKTAS